MRLPAHGDQDDRQQEHHDEVLEKLRKPHATTSPRAFPDPGRARADGPGRADAPRVLQVSIVYSGTNNDIYFLK